MKKTLKKSMLTVAACGLMFAASGCNQQDVATGIIIGGIIGGIAAGGGVSVGTQPSQSYTFLSDCEGYNREWICEYTSGYWYRTQRRNYLTPGNPPPFPPPHHRMATTESLSIQTDADVQAPGVDLKAQVIAKQYSLNDSAAAKLSQAIENAKGGNMKAFDSVGLDLQTMNRLMTDHQIDVNDLNSFADKLETNEQTALNILNSFTNEYAQQKLDVSSALWKQCQSTGHWKTPESNSCTSLDAKGCAPVTGASNCLPQ